MNSNQGYADIFKAVGDETKISCLPTQSELETAYSAGRECEGATRLVRGRLQEVDHSSADLLWKSVAFKPDALGLWYFADPFYDDGRLLDLVVTGGHDDNGGFFWSTGIADALGKENLGKTYTADSPLLAYFDGIEQWREEDWQGVAILKPSAKQLLVPAGFVRLNNWFYVADFAEEYFSENPSAVDGPDNEENYLGALESRALAEVLRTKPRPMWRADPFGWLEAIRIFRGGHPGEPLPAELRVV